MIPTFVIFLREGIEASMIVAILLAYLDRIGQRKHCPNARTACSTSSLERLERGARS